MSKHDIGLQQRYKEIQEIQTGDCFEVQLMESCNRTPNEQQQLLQWDTDDIKIIDDHTYVNCYLDKQSGTLGSRHTTDAVDGGIMISNRPVSLNEFFSIKWEENFTDPEYYEYRQVSIGFVPKDFAAKFCEGEIMGHYMNSYAITSGGRVYASSSTPLSARFDFTVNPQCYLLMKDGIKCACFMGDLKPKQQQIVPLVNPDVDLHAAVCYMDSIPHKGNRPKRLIVVVEPEPIWCRRKDTIKKPDEILPEIDDGEISIGCWYTKRHVIDMTVQTGSVLKLRGPSGQATIGLTSKGQQLTFQILGTEQLPIELSQTSGLVQPGQQTPVIVVSARGEYSPESQPNELLIQYIVIQADEVEKRQDELFQTDRVVTHRIRVDIKNNNHDTSFVCDLPEVADGVMEGPCLELKAWMNKELTLHVWIPKDTYALAVHTFQNERMGFLAAEQQNKSKEDKSFVDENTFVVQPGPYNVQRTSKQQQQCTAESYMYHPTVSAFRVYSNVSKEEQEHNVTGYNLSYLPLYLPRQLTDVLPMPAFRILYDLHQYNVHRLCTAEENVHILDDPGNPVDTNILEKQHVYEDVMVAYVCRMFSSSKMILPSTKHLIPTGAAIDNHLLKQLRRLILRHVLLSAVFFPQSRHAEFYLENRAAIFGHPNFEVKDADNGHHTTPATPGLCTTHAQLVLSSDVKVITEGDTVTLDCEAYQPYSHLVTIFKQKIRGMTHITDDFPKMFPELRTMYMLSANRLVSLPTRLNSLLYLHTFIYKARGSDGKLDYIPQELGLCPSIKEIQFIRSSISTIPDTILYNPTIESLRVSTSLIRSIPTDICMEGLVKLDLSSNPISSLPSTFNRLQNLKELYLSGVMWQNQPSNHYSKENIQQYVNRQTLRILGLNKLKTLCDACDVNSEGELDKTSLVELEAKLFHQVPRFGLDISEHTATGGIPPVIFELKSLEILDLQYQGIRFIPQCISKLKRLRELYIQNCPLLHSLPASLGTLKKMKKLLVSGCSSLQTPPREIRSRGADASLTYLQRLSDGYANNYRTKLMLVGLGGAGKTSLLTALTKQVKTIDTSEHSKRAQYFTVPDLTDGIDIHTWIAKHSSGVEIEYNAWDFAGQTVYYNTHQFFLSNRAIYLLVWNTRLGYEHAGLDFWLSSIRCHAPKAPIFIVGTFADQVIKPEIPTYKLLQSYPQIREFAFVSSVTNQGIPDLTTTLLDATLKESYMGEEVPKVYLTLEAKILSNRAKSSVLSWKQVETISKKVGIFDEKDIQQALQFLHDLGTIQYFDNEFLRDHIVINPQWIVDVMAAVVSVKDSTIQNGMFKHEDTGKVWSKQPEDLLEWLLRLTEAFDLTFPHPEQPMNLVPCLLPHKEPHYNWPQTSSEGEFRDTMFLYRFQYLPAGLFNRIQVRLYQFSSGEQIWKHGSLLKKSNHLALVLQKSDTELIVKVNGPRPENVLLMIHEVIESLIHEAYHGIVYDYLLPCPDCLAKGSMGDTSLLEASLVRDAIFHNAPFLQCRKHFHTISMAVMQASMPPDSSDELEVQLDHSAQALEDIKSAFSTDICISYCMQDLKDEETSTNCIGPRKIATDLQARGLSCWFQEDTDKLPLADLVKSVQNSKMLVAALSDSYMKDTRLPDFLLYVIETLEKPYIIVCIGDTKDWTTSTLGMRIGAQEMYIDMRKSTLYGSKFDSLLDAVDSKLTVLNKTQLTSQFNVFVSYCWKNSHEAQRGKPNADAGLGAVDPRQIKQELHKRGLSCWLDVEQIGKVGLFEDIRRGLTSSDVLVACVSEEYASSRNCMMELRFALCTLNMPTVMVVVGNGNRWLFTEVSMLLYRNKLPHIEMQNTDSKEKFDELEAVVKQKILIQQPNKQSQPETKQQQRDKTSVEETSATPDITAQQLMFREEYELAQRKLLRHMTTLANQMEAKLYPYLIILDFMDEQDTIENIDDARRSSLRGGSSQRPASSRKKLEHRATKSELADSGWQWSHKRFCIKLLCELEQGWHLTETVIPMDPKSATDTVHMIQRFSKYLAKFYSILRHSGLQLNCLTGDEGHAYLDFVNECSNDEDALSFSEACVKLRQQTINIGPEETALKRCHLPTGKINWLCKEHQQGNRITILKHDTQTVSTVQQITTEEALLVEKIMQDRPDIKESQDDLIAKLKDGMDESYNTRIPKKKNNCENTNISTGNTVKETCDDDGKTTGSKEIRRKFSARTLEAAASTMVDRSTASPTARSNSVACTLL